MVEVAAGAQPSAVQRGRSSMPPADSTEGCAAYGPNRSSRPNDLTAKRNVGTTCEPIMSRVIGVGFSWNVAVCSRDQTHDISATISIVTSMDALLDN